MFTGRRRIKNIRRKQQVIKTKAQLNKNIKNKKRG